MRKRFAIRFLLLFLTIVTVGGCTMIPKKREKKLTYAEEMQRMDRELNKHLDKKYGTIVFRQKAFEGGGFDHPEDKWYLEADLSYYWQKDLGKGKAEFIVERRDTEDGEVFKDKFFGLIVRKEFEEWIEKLAKPYFDKYKVIADTWMIFYPNELTVKSNLQDMLKYKEELWSIHFDIMVEEGDQTVEEFQKNAKAFVDEWEKQGVFSAPTITYLTKENYEKSGMREDGKYFVEEGIASYFRVVCKPKTLE